MYKIEMDDDYYFQVFKDGYLLSEHAFVDGCLSFIADIEGIHIPDNSKWSESAMWVYLKSKGVDVICEDW